MIDDVCIYFFIDCCEMEESGDYFIQELSVNLLLTFCECGEYYPIFINLWMKGCLSSNRVQGNLLNLKHAVNCYSNTLFSSICYG